MGRIFGKFADGTDTWTGVLEHKNGVITKMTPAKTSPFKTHRYSPGSFIIFPGFVDPFVMHKEQKKVSTDYYKYGFTHIRLVPCGKLKSIGDVGRLKESKAKQYVVDLANNYSDYYVADPIKLFDAFANSHGVHCTFLPELKSSLDRYATNVRHADKHPPICESEGLDLVMTICERFWVKAAILVSTYSSLKKIAASFNKSFVFYPLICVRHLVDTIDNQQVELSPALREDHVRSALLKNAFIMNTTIFTMLSDAEGLQAYPDYIRSLIKLGVSLNDIANASSLLPNEFLGRNDQGKIKVGYKADFTVLGNDGAVETYVAGELCK